VIGGDKERFVSSSDDLLQRLARFLYAARNPLFITGAGMSADSGLPTYRGVGGLYESGPTAEGISIEDALSGRMLLQRPELAWKYLWQIGSAIRQARPNRGHEVLAAIEREKPRTWVLTQNIDGFHQAAGSRNVIEIHGHLQDLRCVACRYVTGTAAFFHPCTERPPVLPPRCPDCGFVLRPSVVMFGEALPVEAVRALSEVVFKHPPDLVIVIGTTAVFPYIELPVREARERQVPTFEINPYPSAISDLVDGRVPERAACALERLWRPLAPPRR
jgi:NAD-dependent deacetylase